MVNFEILTEHDCQQIIERKFQTNEFQIIDFKIEPFSNEKIGFLGNHYRVTINIQLNTKRETINLFLKQKLNGAVNTMSLISEQAKCYEREIFYLELVSKNLKQLATVTWIPILYLSKDTFIVLDDLSKYGYVAAKNLRGNIENEFIHAKLTMKALAKMHAFTFIYEHEKTREIGRPFYMNEHYGDMLIEPLFSSKVKGWNWVQQAMKVIDKLIDVLPGNHILSPQKFKQLVCKEVYQIQELMKPSKKYPNTLNHGDLWGTNMLYKYDADGNPEDCCLVDFQFVRYLPPMHDVYFYLFINTTTKFRREYTDVLLEYYYEQLSDELSVAGLDINDYYTWDAFIESGREFWDATTIINVMYQTVNQLGKEYWDLFLNDMKFLNDFAFRNRTKYVFDYYRKNPEFRASIIELMVEMRDMFIKRMPEAQQK